MDKIYYQKEAKGKLTQLIKSYWQVDKKDNKAIIKEKIIPDGYPELIFHYGDPYKINISGKWETQPYFLLAGQITNFFFLKNTGQSKIFALKLQPWAAKVIFNIEMFKLTDKVIEISADHIHKIDQIKSIAVSSHNFERKVALIEDCLKNNFEPSEKLKGQKVVEHILENKGVIDLKTIREHAGFSERALERYFKSHIGLSPKFYSRIIRFSNIFKLIQEENINWGDIYYQTGFYDQAHFIKNFKEFTGESPTDYKFFEKNMANLFLKK